MIGYFLKELINSNLKEFKKDFEIFKGLFPFIVILGMIYLINYLLGN